LLEALVAKGVVAVVTTHYAGLKAWAAESTTPGAPPADRMSAAMGYDVDALAPTYRLTLGRPGLSLGLAVAARLGLPAAILERARALVTPQTAELERAIATLETDRRRVAEVGDRLRALETAMRDAVLRQDAAAAALEREREKVAGAAARTIAADVERAKRAIDHILEAARREQTPQRRRLLRKELETLVPAPHPEPDASTHEFEDGARVRVRSLAADGVLLERTHGRRRVRVRVGDREVSVDRTQLAAPVDPDAPVRAAMSPETPQPVSETPPDTLHLLGLRVDEALMRVDRALDEAMAAGVARVRLLHGHGPGRLKAGIRSHLSSSPYVASHRPGEELEGGDAVTIVTLAI
jgi:DNA mismatch repair protein MutS2